MKFSQMVWTSLAVLSVSGCGPLNLGIQPSTTLESHPWSGRTLVFGYSEGAVSIGYDRVCLRPQYPCSLYGLTYAEWRGRKATVEGLALVDRDGLGFKQKYLKLRADRGEDLYLYWELYGDLSDPERNLPRGTYFEDRVASFRSLEGKTIWVNGKLLKKLWTPDPSSSITLHHTEALRVISVTTATLAHIEGEGTFLVQAKDPRGQTGFFPYKKEAFFENNPVKPSWSKDVVRCVRERSVCMGMPPDAVKASWGDPDDINRSVTRYSVSEQWIYGRTYVYLRDGKVDSWQD